MHKYGIPLKRLLQYLRRYQVENPYNRGNTMHVGMIRANSPAPYPSTPQTKPSKHVSHHFSVSSSFHVSVTGRTYPAIVNQPQPSPQSKPSLHNLLAQVLFPNHEPSPSLPRTTTSPQIADRAHRTYDLNPTPSNHEERGMAHAFRLW